jgi:hypothetical protein
MMKLQDMSPGALEDRRRLVNEQKRALQREHGNRLREVAHERIANRARDEIAQADRLLEATSCTGPAGVLDPQAVQALAASWPWRDPAFVQRLHDAVDASPDGEWSPLSASQFAAKLRPLDEEIGRIDATLASRAERRRVLETELATLGGDAA